MHKDPMFPARQEFTRTGPGQRFALAFDSAKVKSPVPGALRRLARRPAIRLAPLTALLACSVLTTACGAAQRGDPQTVVVVASATANEPAPTLASQDLVFLARMGATSTDAVAYVVNANTGQPVTVSLTPRRADGQVEWGPARAQMLAGNVGRVRRLLGQEAASTPFDLLSMIAAAARVTSVPGTLVVVSSGLSTAGALDMRQVGWGADPRAIAAQLKRRGLLPSLARWHVVFSGLGDTAGRQPVLPLPQRAELTADWLAICRAAGAASCVTDAITRPARASQSTTPVPIVPIPAVTSVHGPHHSAGSSIPADTLFAFNSFRLLPGANAILGPMAARAISRHLNVSIVGYASPDGGSASYNKTLSLARAKSVRARLISLGVPTNSIVSVAGYGTETTPRSACYRGGHLDEAVCARLRRVVVLLSAAPGATS